MFKVSKRDLAAPSPMIAGSYILQIKGIRWVCNDIFVNSFHLGVRYHEIFINVIICNNEYA